MGGRGGLEKWFINRRARGGGGAGQGGGMDGGLLIEISNRTKLS